MKKGSSIMLRLLTSPHNGRAKDGAVSAAAGLAAMGPVAGRGTARPQSLAAGADHYGDALRAGPADSDHLAAGRGDQRRLRRLLLLSPAAGTQFSKTGPAAVGLASGEVAAARAFALGGG